MHGNIPFMLDCWADPAVHHYLLLFRKSYVLYFSLYVHRGISCCLDLGEESNLPVVLLPSENTN